MILFWQVKKEIIINLRIKFLLPIETRWKSFKSNVTENSTQQTICVEKMEEMGKDDNPYNLWKATQ